MKNKYLQKVKRDPDLTPFHKRVLSAAISIPAGEVRSYGWIAGKAGSPGASRAVGQALKRNPYAPHVPCHRVIASDGSIGGYSGRGGVKAKRKLLRKEGYKIEAKGKIQ